MLDKNSLEWIHRKPPEPVTFVKRSMQEEANILFEFLTDGIDEEDIYYIKKKYEALVSNDNSFYWLYETNWVHHPDILFICLINFYCFFNGIAI